MKWLQLMLAAMFANGFALVGLKVLAEAGLGAQYQQQYLVGWYASGLAIALAFTLRGFSWPTAREWIIGAGMSLMSFTGQICLSQSLNGGAPGYLVYPIATGGSVLLVAICGVLLFREKLTPYGVAGITCGLLAVVILSLP
jgi:multidrug transporter EmrE-like cation transporter